MSPKAPPVFKRPAQPSPEAFAALEDLAEARGNAVAGQPPASEPPPPPQARDVASSQSRKAAAAPKLPEARSAARSGTQAAPHVRTDGQATRSTTVHLPVDLHQALRMEAAAKGVHMSSIVADAVHAWLAKGGR